MNLFVTGATGVVGRRVVPLLVQAGHRVRAIGRSGSKRAALERQGAEAVEIDLFDAAALRRVLQGTEAVVNLATHMPSSSTRMLLPWSWRENDRVRREGSAALVDAVLAAGVGRFIQESFAPVYQDGGDRSAFISSISHDDAATAVVAALGRRRARTTSSMTSR